MNPVQILILGRFSGTDVLKNGIHSRCVAWQVEKNCKLVWNDNFRGKFDFFWIKQVVVSCTSWVTHKKMWKKFKFFFQTLLYICLNEISNQILWTNCERFFKDRKFEWESFQLHHFLVEKLVLSQNDAIWRIRASASGFFLMNEVAGMFLNKIFIEDKDSKAN